jgi:Response regulator with putative antiterminator output domain
MDSARILIAMSSDMLIDKMRTILVEAGFIVIDSARDGHECLRKIRTLRPDLSILEHNLNLLNGAEVAKVALEDNICDIVLISTIEQSSVIEPFKNYSNFMSLVKPVNKIALLNTLEVMFKSRRRIIELEKEISELKSTLDTRKEVERAKGLLMKHLGLSEGEAFKRIQKQSMDRGIPMKEIAKAIILAYDI